MRTLIYLAVILSFTIIACKKPGENALTNPAPIHFEIIGKDGNNVIHSLKDSLVVNYVMYGVTEAHRLTIYKVQVSATDTTSVSQYNGFVITDLNPATHEGYISGPSGGNVSNVRNFNLYLNGVSIGTFHFDYWGYLSLGYPPPLSSTCTFNGMPVKMADLFGVYNDGSQLTSLNGPDGKDLVYLLQM